MEEGFNQRIFRIKIGTRREKLLDQWTKQDVEHAGHSVLQQP
jgi:hypothetical protein